MPAKKEEGVVFTKRQREILNEALTMMSKELESLMSRCLKLEQVDAAGKIKGDIDRIEDLNGLIQGEDVEESEDEE